MIARPRQLRVAVLNVSLVRGNLHNRPAEYQNLILELTRFRGEKGFGHQAA